MTASISKTTPIIFSIVLVIFFGGCSKSHDQRITKKTYQRAEKFLPQNIHKLVFRSNVQPHWASDSPVFWYRVHTKKGEQYFLVDAKNQTKKPFFNQKKLAKKLSHALNKQIKPYELPLHQLNWNHDKNTFQFRNKGHIWKVNLNTLEVSRIHKNKQANNRLTSTSPNGKWTVTRQNYNLFLTNNETGKEIQLTEDGTKHFIYGAMLPWAWMKQVGPISKKRKPLRLDISWSQNSNMFYAPKLDLRKAKKMYLLQNVPKKGLRSKVFSYYRALPGDDSVATIHPFVFNVQSERKTPIQIKPYAQLTQGRWIWSGSNLYSIQRDRGYKSIALLKANTKTGKVDTLFHRSSKTYIDPLNFQFKFLPKTHELVWLSERSGWNQIYLYNLKTGNVENRVTHGKYVVRHIVDVDPKSRTIYFTAGGRISGQDPYYKHFYRVNFDGSHLKLLTPEDADHDISLSHDHNYFIDHYSRVNLKPRTVLRSTKDGSILMKLEKANIKKLQATGWRYPQPFKLKARNDSTNIYGVIFRPSNFNPNKKYPVIDHIYAGPQAVKTPKSFRRGYLNSDQSLANLGFIVINVDGLGTAERSKKFHDFSYKNLGDAGIPDHVKTIKYLARKYSYIDTSRVGILGHSAGGYDAARAILVRPNFFKAAFAASGDYNLRVAKAWWPELYMGYPAGPDYKKQNDVRLASNLKGKLMLVHGDMDTNVHPAELYRMANALEKNQKDFQMMVIPNYSHGITRDPFYIKLKWNFFVKNLMGSTPPHNYKIGHDY